MDEGRFRPVLEWRQLALWNSRSVVGYEQLVVTVAGPAGLNPDCRSFSLGMFDCVVNQFLNDHLEKFRIGLDGVLDSAVDFEDRICGGPPIAPESFLDDAT